MVCVGVAVKAAGRGELERDGCGDTLPKPHSEVTRYARCPSKSDVTSKRRQSLGLLLSLPLRLLGRSGAPAPRSHTGYADRQADEDASATCRAFLQRMRAHLRKPAAAPHERPDLRRSHGFASILKLVRTTAVPSAGSGQAFGRLRAGLGHAWPTARPSRPRISSSDTVICHPVPDADAVAVREEQEYSGHRMRRIHWGPPPPMAPAGTRAATSAQRQGWPGREAPVFGGDAGP
jgi:hypothetical protein